MESHRPPIKWPIHPFLAVDAHRSIRHSLSELMALRKYAAHINVEKAQNIENWVRGATNWTGSVVVHHRDSSLWPNQLTPCLLSHLSSQARHQLRKHSRRVQRPSPDHSKNANNLIRFVQPHAQHGLIHPHHFPHPIVKLLAITPALPLTTRGLTTAVQLRR